MSVQPEPHDSSDTGTAVPIQRYRTNHIDGDYYPYSGGELVLYADHVQAVAAADTISSKVIADFQRQARESALREALAIMHEQELAKPHHSLCAVKRNYPCNCGRGERLAAIRRLRLIDGGETR